MELSWSSDLGKIQEVMQIKKAFEHQAKEYTPTVLSNRIMPMSAFNQQSFVT